MAGVFRRIEAQTLVDKAAEEVRRLIDEGHFGVGDRLPSERELVHQLGISRTVLREALSSLEALGLIERSSTRGRFVAGGGSGTRSGKLVRAWLRQHAAEIAEIDEVRSLIESQALRAASPEDIAIVVERLGTVLDDQQAAIARGDVARAAAADTDFHKLVCSATRNRTLLDLANALVDRSMQMSLAAYAIPEFAASSLREHTRVVDTLASGDIGSAADLLREHILTSSRRNIDGETSTEAAPARGQNLRARGRKETAGRR